jgi:hypothetical protein
MQPVAVRVALYKLNLDGDRLADLSVHGGEHKAVYCYPIAHYEVGSSPRCKTKTRLGLSAKMPSTALHVHPSWPGNCDKGFGQSATGSYGPVISSPPFEPGTAAKTTAAIIRTTPRLGKFSRLFRHDWCQQET